MKYLLRNYLYLKDFISKKLSDYKKFFTEIPILPDIFLHTILKIYSNLQKKRKKSILKIYFHYSF